MPDLAAKALPSGPPAWLLRVEVPALATILVAGAVLRYWLSTVMPFDEVELDFLRGASVAEASGRTPFVMLNGVLLLLAYVWVRRSAGPEVAFAVLLVLQTSLVYQELALRIRVFVIPLLVVGAVLVYARLQHPPARPRPAIARAALVVAGLLCFRGLFVMASLPAMLIEIPRRSEADAEALYASVAACGGGLVTPAERLRECTIDWPASRSLAQQEALFDHLARAPSATEVTALDAATGVLVFDPAAAALLSTIPEERPVVERVVRGAAPAFFLGR